MDKNNVINIENNNVINPVLLRNVKQPQLAASVVKLREVYIDVESELLRAKKEYGDTFYDNMIDKFTEQYVNMTSLITRGMAGIMDSDIAEAIHEPRGMMG